ncbi:hypothetical protein NCCP2331_10770 [Sporosarcina sp. NCCP-2331]|nr:hypothetical protein NCCP2331_10770 [Sporosarcina sp. NCCP-2331]GLB55034.1 hypothetical protein NCCP2378_08190 [Sporosarcina sp. NCCP-2378]
MRKELISDVDEFAEANSGASEKKSRLAKTRDKRRFMLFSYSPFAQSTVVLCNLRIY